jgi:hypothetical protein
MQQVNKDPVQQAQHVEVNHWLRMMGRLEDPVVARLVLAFLNDNPRQRAQHPGAFLQASETVKRSQIRFAKAYAWGRLAGSTSVAAGRGVSRAAKGLGMLASSGFAGLAKLVHWAQSAMPAKTGGTSSKPSTRRCPVRRRDELHARRGAMRVRRRV